MGQTVADLATGGYRAYYMSRVYPGTLRLLESYGVGVECPDLHFGGRAMCVLRQSKPVLSTTVPRTSEEQAGPERYSSVMSRP